MRKTVFGGNPWERTGPSRAGAPVGAAEVRPAAAAKVKSRPLKGSQEASGDLLTNVFGFDATGSQVKARGGVSGRRGPDTGCAKSALKKCGLEGRAVGQTGREVEPTKLPPFFFFLKQGEIRRVGANLRTSDWKAEGRVSPLRGDSLRM